jgi:hypothetical protein
LRQPRARPNSLSLLLTPVKFKDKFGKHAVQDVVQEIRHIRNNIHAGVALKKNFNPAKF